MHEQTCSGCGTTFKQIGHHWRQSDCQYPELSKKQIEAVHGILMGDGCLHGRDELPYLSCSSTERKFTEFLDSYFENASSHSRLMVDGEESLKQIKDFSPSTNKCKDVYLWTSRSLPQLKRFTSWYDGSGKTWPEEIPMTSTTFKFWYCGDGTYNGNNMRISMLNEKGNEEKIRRYFDGNELIEPNFFTNHRNNFDAVWNRRETEKMFEIIGDPLPGFKYKWPM